MMHCAMAGGKSGSSVRASPGRKWGNLEIGKWEAGKIGEFGNLELGTKSSLFSLQSSLFSLQDKIWRFGNQEMGIWGTNLAGD